LEGAYLTDGKGLTLADILPGGIKERGGILLGQIPLSYVPNEKKFTYPNHEAIDHYHHYKEDIKLFGEMGFKVYRTSIS
jgi:6-phospho-beta-glucosidase